MDGLDTGMRDLASALSTIGEKVDRLTEVTLAVERMSTSTAAAVEACYGACIIHYTRYRLVWYGILRGTVFYTIVYTVCYGTRSLFLGPGESSPFRSHTT